MTLSAFGVEDSRLSKRMTDEERRRHNTKVVGLAIPSGLAAVGAGQFGAKALESAWDSRQERKKSVKLLAGPPGPAGVNHHLGRSSQGRAVTHIRRAKVQGGVAAGLAAAGVGGFTALHNLKNRSGGMTRRSARA